ncbi:MAG: NAD(+) synthase [Lachnospiraceae bacterium]|nr:NAD(+) synthase [Lachnospiraceae bacterium]
MKDGFVKVAAITPKVTVADVRENTEEIIYQVKEAGKGGAKVIVLPELCVTGYTCQDLFLQDILLREAKEALFQITEQTKEVDALIFVGMPLEHQGKLYNTAAVLSRGMILGFVPKYYLPNYNEFYEVRYFTRGMREAVQVQLSENLTVPMGTNLLFCCRELPELKIAAEICEDLWNVNPPSISHAQAGAILIANLSASDEITGKDVYRRELVTGQAARLLCGYLYASAGEGESTQDVVYSGHNLIAENGNLLAESERFTVGILYSEIDVKKLTEERRRLNSFEWREEGYQKVFFSVNMEETKLSRHIDAMPFVPENRTRWEKRCEEILDIQAHGLKKRLAHTKAQSAVVGISGGLDSTLALLVTVKAFDLLRISRERIIAVTMPGFGTTDRTYDNAVHLIHCLGTKFMEISITDAVDVHFRDIGQDKNVHDVTYENAQARERTQILMDIANKENGLVVGTGDMSELALGWATYNGDHMSMYGVNSSVPKTLVRHLVRYYAETCQNEELSEILQDVLDTPVSPELLPPEDGEISQKTEDIVGPYELHDFFLYYLLRFGYAPVKIYRLAQNAFAEIYENDVILKWLKIFIRRFFSQHFKRSCLPDGPKVGTVAVSPRGDLRMPSDASARIWLEELERM